jgi:hypothetical protein
MRYKAYKALLIVQTCRRCRLLLCAAGLILVVRGGPAARGLRRLLRGLLLQRLLIPLAALLRGEPVLGALGVGLPRLRALAVAVPLVAACTPRRRRREVKEETEEEERIAASKNKNEIATREKHEFKM